MQWLARICIERPVFASVLVLLICVLGTAGYTRLGVDRFPNIDLPIITIVTVLPGASPADIETEITEPIEAAVNSVGGLDELRSDSYEGVSVVVCTFRLEKDTDTAVQEVRDRVESVVGSLPQGTERPVISKVDPAADPVVYLAVRGSVSPQELTRIADDLVRRRLENVMGVGQIGIIGGAEREIEILLDPMRMQAVGISAPEIAATIASQNVVVPGGRLDEGASVLGVRIQGRFVSIPEIAMLVLRATPTQTLRLNDVAEVRDGVAELETSASWNGERSIVLAVRKQSGANTVAVVDALVTALDSVRAELPEGVQLDVLRDESTSIRTGTHAVTEHLILGAIFAALVVLLFLGNVRSTVIAAIAIPTSIVGTYLLMWLAGYTLNTITLLALALSVGIVVDDAIVVLENIVKHMEGGKSAMQAAIDGTQEIGLAVLATTLSLIAVFLPVVFLAGVPGRFLRSFGLTMSFAIIISLFISFTLTPMLSSRWLKSHDASAKKSLLERGVDAFYLPIERVYMAMLEFSMRHRWLVVLACIASLATIPFLAGRAQKGFLPRDDKGQFEVRVRLPEGASLSQTTIEAERIATAIRAQDHVAGTLVTVGDDEQHTPNLGRIYVRLTPPEERDEDLFAILERVRALVAPMASPGTRIVSSLIPDIGGNSAAAFQLVITGDDIAELERISNRILTAMRADARVADPDSSLLVGRPEVVLRADRMRMSDQGVGLLDVAQTIRLLVAGEVVSTFDEGGERHDVRLRAALPYRNTPAALDLLQVRSQSGRLVPLSSVSTRTHALGPAALSHFQRELSITLTADPANGFELGDVQAVVDAELAREALPPGYRTRVAGQAKFMAETATSFVFGTALAFIFMYLVLAAQFESWLHPITILCSLPLTIPFAILSIILFGQAMNIFSMLGIFVLFGIVKKNSILQVDRANQLRREGVPRLEAILRANRDRLRPILMTTIAFVVGMIPLATSRGIGAGFNHATAGVTIGGQTLSLLLTLLAVPVLYSLFDDVALAFGRIFGSKTPKVPQVTVESESTI